MIRTPIRRRPSRNAAPRSGQPSSSNHSVSQSSAPSRRPGSSARSKARARADRATADCAPTCADALPITERNQFSHASQHQGRCTPAVMTGTPRCCWAPRSYLAETRNFAGTVHFIFQPAEENEGGGRRDGGAGACSTRYPVEAVYGMHNWPGLPAGPVRDPRRAADGGLRHLRDHGRRARGAHARHAAHLGIDPDRAGGADRHAGAADHRAAATSHPLEGAVVSVTQIHGGDTWNVIPDSVVLRGTDALLRAARCATPSRTGDPPDRRGRAALARAPGCECATSGATRRRSTARRRPRSLPPPRRSWSAPSNVIRDLHAEHGRRGLRLHAAEAARRLHLIGNGATPSSAMLHNPHYDFNDEILTTRRQLLGPPRWSGC